MIQGFRSIRPHTLPIDSHRAGPAGRVSNGERVDLERVGIAADVFAEALARGEQVEAVCRDWAAAA